MTTPGTADTVVFTVAPVAGGNPVKLVNVDADTPPTSPTTIIAFRDADYSDSSLGFTVSWITGNGDDLLQDGELAEITVTLPTGVNAVSTNMPFTLEVKPPTGAVIDINRTTPPAIETVMELH